MVAAPPPISPLIRCFIMKSRPRAPALTTGCQHSTGWGGGRGARGGALRSLPRLGEGGGGRGGGRAAGGPRAPEVLAPAGVVPAPHAEAGAPASEDVGGGEVLRQPERVPHGG